MYKHSKPLARLVTFSLMLTLIILSPFQNVAAQQPSALQGPTDPAEVEAFFDKEMAVQLNDLHIPGAVVLIVRNGEILFSKGYGYSDLQHQTPIVADKTLFRVGSVTKLFTATAVMQLVEQGKLDMNSDVNTYLKDFQIPATYPQPITLTNLLTHTAGFDVPNFGLATLNPTERLPLGEWLARNIPTRVRPPGQLSSYSNYGMALAGYIVEVVSGVPYEQYIKDNILKPLGMQHTTLLQPLPPEFAPDMAAGYIYANGAYVQQPFEQYQIVPAGAMTSSATDIAHFMIAHLNNGCYKDQCILQKATAQRMHSTLFRPDPNVNGYAYGFEEDSVNNQWIIGHAGKTFGFRSMLELLPGQSLGFFVSYNTTTDGMTASAQLFQDFMDHYYPYVPTNIKPSVNFTSQASRFTGSYRWVADTPITTVDKMVGLISPMHIQVTSDGYLTMDGNRFVQVEPLVFREASGTKRLVFREDAQGSITHAFYDGDPESAFVKLPWYENPDLHLILIAVSLLVLLSGVVASLIGWIVRRLRKYNDAQPRLGQLASWTVIVTTVLNILFLVGITVTVSDPNSFFLVGNTLIMQLVLTPPMISAVLTLGMIVMTTMIWRMRTWRLSGRIHYTLVTLAAVAFIIILNYWNLLGWKLGGS